MPVVESQNLRRLMAQQGLTTSQVVDQTGLDQRTIRAVLKGVSKPHTRTLHRLAEGLGVPVDEFYVEQSQLQFRQFDRGANPVAEEVVHEHPELFDGWAAADYDELHSRVGTGGAMTRQGVLRTVEDMNEQRRLHEKLAVILEGSQKEIARGMIELLYQQTLCKGPTGASETAPPADTEE